MHSVPCHSGGLALQNLFCPFADSSSPGRLRAAAATSQTIGAHSSPNDTTVRPSGEKTASQAVDVAPPSVCRSRPVTASHSSTRPSPHAEATTRPPGPNESERQPRGYAAHRTCAFSLPRSHLHTRVPPIGSPLVPSNVLPSREKASRLRPDHSGGLLSSLPVSVSHSRSFPSKYVAASLPSAERRNLVTGWLRKSSSAPGRSPISRTERPVATSHIPITKEPFEKSVLPSGANATSKT
jgi:hypothetical protein